VGKLELRVPQERSGHFSTELFERYQRSERALVATLAEMYVQGVSTRKVKAITEELCGHAFSASSISAINKRLDESLKAFAERPLQEPFAYLILDARYEKVREAGVVMSQAVLIAVGIDWDGRRQILSVEMAGRESRCAWKDFLVRLKGRGLKGVELVVSDDHAGLVAAIGEVIPEAAWQRCYVHFLRNALDHLPRKHGDDCLQELRWLYDRRDLDEAKADLAAWLGKWSVRYPRLTSWVEETIEQTLTFFRLPRQHHKPQEHQHAGTPQRGNPPQNLRRAHLSQHRELPTPRPRARRRNPRKLDGGQSLHQHGRPARAQETRTPSSRMTSTHDRPILQNLTHTTEHGLAPDAGVR
jgi:putative transposase